MGLFSKEPDAPLAVEAFTPEYAIAGDLTPASTKWAWTYLQTTGAQDPANALSVAAPAVRPTGALPAPAPAQTAHLSIATGLIALAPRGGAADELWEEWAKLDKPVPARILAGPYLIAGNVLTPGGDVAAVMLGRAITVRDATLARVDGAGDATPVALPRVTVFLRFVDAVLD